MNAPEKGTLSDCSLSLAQDCARKPRPSSLTHGRRTCPLAQSSRTAARNPRPIARYRSRRIALGSRGLPPHSRTKNVSARSVVQDSGAQSSSDCSLSLAQDCARKPRPSSLTHGRRTCPLAQSSRTAARNPRPIARYRSRRIALGSAILTFTPESGQPRMEAISRSTRSSLATKGSLQSTVRCAWSLSFRCTQSTV